MAKNEARALLLTGPPGVGKTTCLRRAAETLRGIPIHGFVTEEIREAGQRMGFRIETFDGDSEVFAHVKIRSPHRVSKYGVDVDALERVVSQQFSTIPAGGVVLLDEIGKMECLSGRFLETVESLLDAGAVLVATVALRGSGLIERVKRRSGVLLWTITRANRQEMPQQIAGWVRSRVRS